MQSKLKSLFQLETNQAKAKAHLFYRFKITVKFRKYERVEMD